MSPARHTATRHLIVRVLLLALVGACTSTAGETRAVGELRDPFAQWADCPPDSLQLTRKLAALDSVALIFYKLPPDSLETLAAGDDWKGAYLRLLAPHVLPESLLEAVSVRCWVHYESVSQRLQGQPDEGRSLAEDLRAWEGCLRNNWLEEYDTRYRPFLAPLLVCLHRHTDSASLARPATAPPPN